MVGVDPLRHLPWLVRALGVGGVDPLRHLPWLGKTLDVGRKDPLRHLPGGVDPLRHLPWLGRALGYGGVDPLRHLPQLGRSIAVPPSARVSSFPELSFCASMILNFFVAMAVTLSRFFFQLLGYVTPSCVVYSAAWLYYSRAFLQQ